jgi:hypothetical protein
LFFIAVDNPLGTKAAFNRYWELNWGLAEQIRNSEFGIRNELEQTINLSLLVYAKRYHEKNSKKHRTQRTER